MRRKLIVREDTNTGAQMSEQRQYLMMKPIFWFKVSVCNSVGHKLTFTKYSAKEMFRAYFHYKKTKPCSHQWNAEFLPYREVLFDLQWISKEKLNLATSHSYRGKKKSKISNWLQHKSAWLARKPTLLECRWKSICYQARQDWLFNQFNWKLYFQCNRNMVPLWLQNHEFCNR